MNSVNIDPLSTTSLYVQQIKDTEILGSATGFVIELNGNKYLITNWHVVNCKNPETNKPSREDEQFPNKLNILYHSSSKLGEWVFKSEDLFNADGTKKWFEHPGGRSVDLIILPLLNIGSDITIYPIDLNLKNTDILATPAMPVSIIGYPFGIGTGGAFPIWKTGHIASDPDLNYDNRPAFLIDATTRGGMSGSPVIIRVSQGYKTKNGNTVLAGGAKTLFLGVYSGRIHKDSELGLVWRPTLIEEIARNAGII